MSTRTKSKSKGKGKVTGKGKGKRILSTSGGSSSSSSSTKRSKVIAPQVRIDGSFLDRKKNAALTKKMNARDRLVRELREGCKILEDQL